MATEPGVNVCVCVCLRERENNRERETDGVDGPKVPGRRMPFCPASYVKVCGDVMHPCVYVPMCVCAHVCVYGLSVCLDVYI